VDKIQSIIAQPLVNDLPCGFILNPKIEGIKYKPTIVVKAKLME
jgi:hypothetical protein